MQQSHHALASQKLRDRCQFLEAHSESTLARMHFLEERQTQLLSLQSGVMELWTLMTEAAEFNALTEEKRLEGPTEMLQLLKVTFSREMLQLIIVFSGGIDSTVVSFDKQKIDGCSEDRRSIVV